ncbi:hypothetical protein TRVA0_003S00144 [Trichomonascus vanleenenianus]|uniref:Pef1p n=1 Tax=Trichomonascus vanleenenianus TaxID=2268995 RepID=UPI003ECAC0FB
MGKDDLPAFPTPKETFGYNPPPRRENTFPVGAGGQYPNSGYPGGGGGAGYIPPPPQPRYGPYGASPTAGYPPPAPPPGAGYGGGGGYYQQGPPPPGPPGGPMGGGRGPYDNRQPPIANPYSPQVQSPRTSLGDQPNLRALFSGVDRNGNGTLSEAELGNALINGDYTKFHKETVKLMIKMFDRNGDGAIDYEEFGNLWKYLRDWRKIFDKFDLDRSGNISFDEYVRALDAFGYSLSNQTIQQMYNSYASSDRYGGRTISFDMFVQSCISLKRTTDSFKRYDTDRDGYITLGFEQYLLEMMALK